MNNFQDYFNFRKTPYPGPWLNDPDQVRKAGDLLMQEFLAGRLNHLELAQAATALREMARNRSPPPALGFDARLSAIEGFQRGIEAAFHNSLHRISEMRWDLWNERSQPQQAEGAGFVALGTSSGPTGAEPITTIPISSAPNLGGARSSGVPGISSPASGPASRSGFASSGVPGPISQASGSSSSSGSRGGGAQHRYNPMGGDATGRRHEKKSDKEYFVLVTCTGDPSPDYVGNLLSPKPAEPRRLVQRGIVAAQYPTANEARQACSSIKDEAYQGREISARTYISMGKRDHSYTVPPNCLRIFYADQVLTYGEEASGKLRHRALGSQEHPAGQIWITVKRSDVEPNGNVPPVLRLEIVPDSRVAVNNRICTLKDVLVSTDDGQSPVRGSAIFDCTLLLGWLFDLSARIKPVAKVVGLQLESGFSLEQSVAQLAPSVQLVASSAAESTPNEPMMDVDVDLDDDFDDGPSCRPDNIVD
ncbi:hypothetical protein HDU88_001791 [Geranomyces variabilis]|nr:hypothetical protein HDU88_001791 [Geranomyces variabilis]